MLIVGRAVALLLGGRLRGVRASGPAIHDLAAEAVDPIAVDAAGSRDEIVELRILERLAASVVVTADVLVAQSPQSGRYAGGGREGRTHVRRRVGPVGARCRSVAPPRSRDRAARARRGVTADGQGTGADSNDLDGQDLGQGCLARPGSPRRRCRGETSRLEGGQRRSLAVVAGPWGAHRGRSGGQQAG